MRHDVPGFHCTPGPDKASALTELCDDGIYTRLQLLRSDHFPLSVSCCHHGAVPHGHLSQSVGKILVAVEPLFTVPIPVSEDALHQEHVGDGVAHGLVDHVHQSVQLGATLRPDQRLSLLVEDHGAMTVGLKVDSDGELDGSVVQVLDPGGCEGNRDSKLVGDVRGAAAIGICSLH